MEISSASYAYPRHGGYERSGLAERLLARPRLESGFVLATCLRVEVAVPGGIAELDGALLALFGELAEDIAPRVRQGEEAVAHLFRVAAGLESPILGEQEILTQFRQELIRGEQEGEVHGLFARLLEAAVSNGRQARELLPSSPHNSMAAVAAQATALADRVAVLGSGIMATAVVEALRQLPAPPHITVVARSPEKVPGTGDVEVWGFEQAAEALSSFPAVVSATSAKRRLVDDEALAEVVSRRKARLVLVDMAMPPDFRPPHVEEVTYINIDDLARMAGRRPRAAEADRHIEAAAADAYRQYRDHHELGPVIGALMRTADELVDATVNRFSGRLRSEDDRAVLRQAAHTLARTLLDRPVSYLKQTARDPGDIGVIAQAFGVEDE